MVGVQIPGAPTAAPNRVSPCVVTASTNPREDHGETRRARTNSEPGPVHPNGLLPGAGRNPNDEGSVDQNQRCPGWAQRKRGLLP